MLLHPDLRTHTAFSFLSHITPGCIISRAVAQHPMKCNPPEPQPTRFTTQLVLLDRGSHPRALGLSLNSRHSKHISPVVGWYLIEHVLAALGTSQASTSLGQPAFPGRKQECFLGELALGTNWNMLIARFLI